MLQARQPHNGANELAIGISRIDKSEAWQLHRIALSAVPASDDESPRGVS